MVIASLADFPDKMRNIQRNFSLSQRKAWPWVACVKGEAEISYEI